MSFSGWLLSVLYFSPTVTTHDSPLYFTDRRSLFGLCFDPVSMSWVRSNCLELVDREEFTCVFSPDVPEGTRCGFVNGLSLNTIYLSGDSSICISLLHRGKFTWFLQHTCIILSLFELISDNFPVYICFGKFCRCASSLRISIFG